MRYIVVALIAVILVSCSPQRRLARLLERFPLDTTSVVEYRDTTLYRDTTIYERILGDTIRRDIYIPIEIDLPDTSLKLMSTLAEASAGIRSNTLWLELIQYDTVFQFILDSALVENIDTVFVTNNIPYPVVKKANPFYKNGFFILAGLILISLILLFVVRKR
ncbi:hypothetical protein LCGC14_2762630 [marine sediment metagenome]|uniref:Uncharacterized protein n=1 Tax=marine sediment metagenome TaxID=412755 RepID=A0A0F8ZKF2_9ZZZZ